MHVKWEILTNGDLRLFMDAGSRAELIAIREEAPERFDSQELEYELLEPIICNGLCSTSSSFTGDLTDAPMLCETISDHGWPEGKYWAYMDYCLRFIQKDLVDDGECIWQSGGELPPYDRTHFPGPGNSTLCGIEIKEYTNPLRDTVTPRLGADATKVDCYRCEDCMNGDVLA